ncbi:Glycosyltransferase family 15 protein [Mycena venus]|uniref:Glycosyltransferase family 15 protein n=1 Tax=Mycena venus TaxID=2733690 RepID=A0A8H6XIP6_9AGAR|nr:Glycosyltransferase family 15 protein [Mycena venus]
MHRRTRYSILACIVMIALIALYRKYSPLLSIDRDFDEFPVEAEPTDFAGVSAARQTTFRKASQTQFSSDFRRANATFVMLARNSDLEGALLSVRALEDRFNRRFGYPYVFLNEEEFSEDFKRRIRNLTPSRVEFGVIPKEHWYQPDWIDKDKARKEMDKMRMQNVKYGGDLPYHNMCRFNSGFFFKHPLMQKYRWYWRVEPKVKFYCDINQDPFLFMEDNDKVYGFTLAVYEIPATIRTLWSTVRGFMDKHPEYIRTEDNALRFISSDSGHSYNRCHFWSNFEIASLDFWRGEAYTAFFEHLDATGGFYYERWGDAPVHSIAAALFLKKSQIHLFEDIGYQHDDWGHCPQNQELWEKGRCICNIRGSHDYSSDSCRSKWDALGA